MYQQILTKLASKNNLTREELEILLQLEFQDIKRASAFGINRENGFNEMRKRSEVLTMVLDDVVAITETMGFNNLQKTLDILWRFWLPFALQLLKLIWFSERPFIQGILGVQGTGKTTLAIISRLILGKLGYAVLNISLDDFYKTYQERQQLQQQDPRLIWRGPPGTHDLELAINLLDQIRQGDRNQKILVPRFDKSAYHGQGDRAEFETVSLPDLVIFEGWFIGVIPISPEQFTQPIDPILTREDQKFALDINKKLADYLPLWQRLDRLIVLHPQDYRYSKQWRKEAEQKMITSGKKGMNDEEIEKFVDYFWKAIHPELFIPPLIKNPELVDFVVEITENHDPYLVYPSSY